MSVVTASTSKGEKSKKFQSLDINNIYQGSATKPTQKSLPQKHGLQSLGKVPTARRAPANLPSLKAENGGSGNDAAAATAAINLVPSGSAGWAKDEQAPGSQGGSTSTAASVHPANKNSAPASAPPGSNSGTNGKQLTRAGGPIQNGQASHPNNAPPPDLSHFHHQQQVPSWKNVASSSAPNSSQPAFLGQRSNPLFGQEFPSLTPNGTSDAGQPVNPTPLQASASSGSIAQKLKGESNDSALKYGPGPNLRPQSYGNWALGTGASGGASTAKHQNSDNDSSTHSSTHPTLPNASNQLRGVASGVSVSSQQHNSSSHQPGVPVQQHVTSSFKFDVSTKPGAASISGIRKSASSSNAAHSSDFKKAAGDSGHGPKKSQGSGRPHIQPPATYQAPGFLQQQIIDVEKLKRLDELDNAESDWTKSDNTFDYNKKIASDDEEDFHSDWTSQIKPSKSATAIAAQAPANSEPPQQLLNNSSQQQQQAPRRVILPAHSTSNDFVDEEKERQAKNEEVLKTIERAKRRREEEEQKYGKAEGRQQYGGGRGGGDVYDNSGYEGGRYPDAPPPRRQHSGSDRNNRKSPGLGGSRGGPSGDYRQQQHSGGPDRGSFGKFDVGGKEEDGPSAASPPSSASNEAGTGRAQGRALGPDPGTRGGPPKYSVYDDRHKGWADSQTFPADPAVKPLPQPQSSVPPRFKRNGMELHAVKRASPPKEPSPGKQAGSAGGGAGENSDKGSVDAATPSSYSSRASSTRKSPGCWDRQSTGSSTEPSLATAPAGSGPPLQVLPPPSENSPEPATDSASASDLPAAPAGSGSVSRHLSSGSGSSAAAAAAPPSHNDKKDMFKDFPGGDTANSAPSYDNWGGQSRGSGKPFASEQSSDSRFSESEKPRQNRNDRGGGGGRGMRGGGSGRGGGPRADPRADRPNNKPNNDRQSQHQQQAKKPGGLPGNKNVSGNKGGQARKPEVEETSGPSEFSPENAGSEQPAQPAAVPMEVKMVDASADLMKNLALSSATDLDSPIPTLDQLQPKPEPDQDSKRLEEVGQAKQQPVQMENSVGGWFAPRGQPSRRGRGGLSAGGGQLRPHPSAVPGGPESEGANAVLAPDQQSKADVEWDASSDRSFEDKKMASSDNYFSGGNRGGNRGSGRYNGGANMGNNRQANIKEGAKQLPPQRIDGRLPAESGRGMGPGSGRDKLGGPHSVGSGMGPANNAAVGGNVGGYPGRDDNRRQNKLPPRLAKQKEQNRLAAGSTGWGDPPIQDSSGAGNGGFSTWDGHLQQHHRNQQQMMHTDFATAGGPGNSPESAFRNDAGSESNLTMSALTDPSKASSVAPGIGGGESQNSAPMQTIIFENTNFKGRQQGGPGASPAPMPSVLGEKMGGFKPADLHMAMDFSEAAAAAAAAAGGHPDKDLRLDFGSFGGEARSSEHSGGSAVNPKMVGVGQPGGPSGGGQVIPPAASPATSGSVSSAHHPTTEDLNMKIASVKKVWEMDQQTTLRPAMDQTFSQGFQPGGASGDPKAFVSGGPTVSVSASVAAAVSSSMEGASSASSVGPSGFSEKTPSGPDGVSSVTTAGSNVAKVRPQQQMPQAHQSQVPMGPGQGYPAHTAAAGFQLGAESSIMADRAAALRSMMSQSAAAASQAGGAGAPGSYGRLPTQLQSPQSLLNQPPNLYQAFQLDHGRGVPTGAPPGPPPGPPTNQLYPYPAAAAPGLSGAAQSVLLSSSGAGSGNTAGTDMFGSQSQFRLQNNSSFGQAASTTLSNPVLLPQSINSAIKQSAAAAAAQIGPIGTKANSFQTALGGAPPPGPPPPPAGTSPLHLIPYDTTGAAGASHYANARLAAAANQASGQTAFYAALAASQQQSNRAAAAAASGAGFPNPVTAHGFTAAAQAQAAGAFGAMNAHMRSAVAQAQAAQVAAQTGQPQAAHMASYMAKASADAVAAAHMAKRNEVGGGAGGFGGLNQFNQAGKSGSGGYSAAVSVSNSVSSASSANGHGGGGGVGGAAQPSVTSSSAVAVSAAAVSSAAVAASALGRNYSPTPIQRPAHQSKVGGTDEDSVFEIKDKKKAADEN